MKMDLTFEGFEETQRALQWIEPVSRLRAVRSALVSSMNVMRKEARANLANHKRTGNLESNLRIRSRVDAGGEIVVTLHTGRAFYGMFLEFGTRHMPGNRWLTRAMDSTEREVYESFGDKLWRVIERRSRKWRR